MARNPWDSFPLPEKGDETNSITFEAVGRATSDWEYLEAYLGLIFAVLIGSLNTTDAAMRAYGSIIAFSARCGMLKAAKEVFFLEYPNEQLESEFDQLEKDAGRFSGRRNEIAHGIVQPYFVDGAGDTGAALIPSYHATNKRKLGAQVDAEYPQTAILKYAYTSNEIAYFSGQFQELSKRALDLYRGLHSHRAGAEQRRKTSMLARHLVDGQPQPSETGRQSPLGRPST
jgi:hypothetical protein